MVGTMDDVRKVGQARDRRLRRRPEPTSQHRRYLMISVDDHLVEPPNLFIDHVPSAMRDRVPCVKEGEKGEEYWLLEGEKRYLTGSDAVVGWKPDTVEDWMFPIRYEEMRLGCYDPLARVHDMDIAGIYASLAFPSTVWGFCGQKIWGIKDEEVAQACVRGYNDWLAEEWVAAAPDRLIPNGIVYMRDPDVAANEVRRNAERGFHAVSLSENPQWLGLPSVYTRYWDPLLRACEETGTVINLHLGSSSSRPITSSDAPIWVSALLWPAHVMSAATEWIFSQACLRFPKLRLVFSEGGVGWVPMLWERISRAHRMKSELTDWPTLAVSPMDVLLGNFWFCAIEEPISLEQRYHIGVDRILLESDYPHSDTSWPESQAVVHEQVKSMTAEDIRCITYGNAAKLYNHKLPPAGEWWPKDMAAEYLV